MKGYCRITDHIHNVDMECTFEEFVFIANRRTYCCEYASHDPIWNGEGLLQAHAGTIGPMDLTVSWGLQASVAAAS